MDSLTVEQSALAEENERLIYYALKRFGITDIDEYYGFAAVGLCKAAKYWAPERGKFSTFAMVVMRNELHLARRSQRKDVKPSVSIDYRDDDGACLQLAAPDSFETVESRMLRNYVVGVAKARLKPKDYETFESLLYGEKTEVFAHRIGQTYHSAATRRVKVRKKLRTVFNHMS